MATEAPIMPKQQYHLPISTVILTCELCRAKTTLGEAQDRAARTHSQLTCQGCGYALQKLNDPHEWDISKE